MSEPAFVILNQRGVIRLEGPDARAFLQGLVSNDVHKVAPGRAVYAALLTPQGKYLHDLFVVELEGALCLDCEAERLEDLMRRLTVFRLRSKVALTDACGAFAVAVLFGAGATAAVGLSAEPGHATAFAGGVAYVDPRLAEAGLRALLPREGAEAALEQAGFKPAPFEGYERLRLALGLPDGSRDLSVEKAMLLENGLDELGAIDWDKGCYLGQELTARMRYRGLTKKRLMPVAVEGPLPAPGTPVMAGEVESGLDDLGLALLRLDAVGELLGRPGALTAGAARLTARKPNWARF
jgi:folate-binding protein YgfZ